MKHVFVAGTLLLLSSCTSRDKNQASTAEHEAPSAPAQATALPVAIERDSVVSDINTQLSQCQQRLDDARSTLADTKSALAVASDDAPRAELEKQLSAAQSVQRELRADLDRAQQALADARAKLDSRDYDAALQELAETRTLLEHIELERSQTSGSLTLEIAFTVAGQPLLLDRTYQLGSNTLTFSAVRYWLSNVRLVRADSSPVDVPDSFYLMEVRKEEPLRGGTQRALTLPARRREVVQIESVPPGSYSALSFDVGVDAAHNDDLSLSGGELTVLKNTASLQWNWFTSYIFTRLQGAATAQEDGQQDDAGARAATQLLWENGTNADLRRVELTLPMPVRIGLDTHPTLKLALDTAIVLRGLDSQLASARAASTDAPFSDVSAFDDAARATLADNWKAAFKVADVRYGAQ